MQRRLLPMAAAVLAVLLTAAACGETTVTPTAPESAAPQALPGPTAAPATDTGSRVAVWGDVRNSGSDPAASEGFVNMVRALAAFRFRASIALGDYIDGSGDGVADRQKYEGFLAAARPITAKGRVIWAPGNHERLSDADDHLLWHEMLWHEEVPSGDPTVTQRHHWGPFRLAVGTKTLHGFMLSSVESGVADGTIGFKTATPDTTPGSAWLTQSRQARELVRWLRARPRTQYVVVVVHHPLLDPKTNASYTEQPYVTERNALVRLFARSGVDLVLQGDVHNYRRHVAAERHGLPHPGDGRRSPLLRRHQRQSRRRAARDDRDVKLLGSPSGGPDRYGFTILRQTTSGRIKADDLLREQRAGDGRGQDLRGRQDHPL